MRSSYRGTLLKAVNIQQLTYSSLIHRIKAVSINIKTECLTLSSFCRSQLGLILRVGLTLKSSSKITLGLILRVGLIIGETR